MSITESYPEKMTSFDERVIAMWLAGKNTADIAEYLGLSEAQIANRLPRILQSQRLGR